MGKPKRPPALTEPPHLVYYGCPPYTPERDLAYGYQDDSGVWHPGDQRRSAPCTTCGKAVDPNGYCEPCSTMGTRFQAGPPVKPGADPDVKPPVHRKPSPKAKAKVVKLSRKAKRRQKTLAVLQAS